MRPLYLVLLILVIGAALIEAQQQNRRKNGGGGGGKQQHQQQQNNKRKPMGKPNGNRNNNRNNNRNKNGNKMNKEKPTAKKTLVNHIIPGLGAVRGRVVKSEWTGQTIIQFFDIPYAQGASGAMRFKPASPVAPWTGTMKTERPFGGCPSIQDDKDYDALKARNIEAEDCLSVTISTKSFSSSSPVMVYIHGDNLYDGSVLDSPPGYLLEEDIVLVLVRYRLGPFGFLSTMTDDIPGNAGVTDVILALKWVQNNIASFGGDPNKVTLFGQSGGAAMVNILTMSPAVSDGLFHRVIYQSGSALSPAFITDNPLPAAKDIGKYAGCKNVNKVESLNKCLRKLNTTELLDAFSKHGASKIGQGVGSTGAAQFVVGGPSDILPQFPAKLLTSGNFKAYPTMGGTPKNAGTLPLKDIYIDSFNETIPDDQMNATDYVKQIIVETNGPDRSGAWMKFAKEEIFTEEQMKNGSFRCLTPGLIDLCGTIAYKNPVLLAMQGNAGKMPNNTYLYSFDYEGEFNRYGTFEDQGDMPFELGVSLTDENLYLFPWPRYSMVNTNRDMKVAARMVKLWASFAATGKPTAPNMPEWPAMTGSAGPYLKIGKTVSVGDNYIDEFTAAVQEADMGYSLVNDDYFDVLMEDTEEDDNSKEKEEEEEDNDNDSPGEARGGNIVLIAHRNKY
ncbi:glutactin [Stomoxys calcitrans]|uniref:glutactin n=1 Tax=Stomoxys calcitrans TaxID=35570 RepID=UPI0027E27F58|nr:glutactin [Stomoxys calcitrans]